MLFLQEHTDDLQNKAMTSLFNLVCSLYKVCLQPERCLLLPFQSLILSMRSPSHDLFFLCVYRVKSQLLVLKG